MSFLKVFWYYFVNVNEPDKQRMSDLCLEVATLIFVNEPEPEPENKG